MSAPPPSAKAAAAAAHAQVAAWLAFCQAHPGQLPPDIAAVQSRLIRTVGRGRLANGDDVFLKAMGFPRARDRLRYWLRALPAQHEADMLRVARAADVPCPEVVGVSVRRGRWRVPVASTLATLGLDLLPGVAPRLHTCSVVAHRLLQAGIHHPDLHEKNFVALVGGGAAVLDLQSARGTAKRASRARRVALAGRLLAADWPQPECPESVVQAGLLDARDLQRALRWAQRARQAAVRRRVLRCLQESTEFAVFRRPWGSLVQRRTLAAGGVWLRGGRALIRAWIGARYCEVVEREPPLLGVLFRNSWWLPRRCSVYIADAKGSARFEECCGRWLDAFVRFKNMTGGGSCVPTLLPEAELPWSGRREV